MENTSCQNKAIEEFKLWLDQSDVKNFVLEGFAGTGKSYITKQFIDLLKEKGITVATLAYTGKAANVIQQYTGNPSTTIHKFIYKFDVSKMFYHNEDEEKQDLKEGKMLFIQKAKCLIIDEFSLITEEILTDLLKLNKLLIFVGDTKQLPPISGKAYTSKTFLKALNGCFKARLETVVRQLLDQPITAITSLIRHNKTNLATLTMETDFEKVNITKKLKLNMKLWSQEDYQILVHRNKTKNDINKKIRLKLGYNGILEKNEKIIITKNNYTEKLFNGEQFRIASVGDELISFGFRFCQITIEYIDGSELQKSINVLLENLIDPDWTYTLDENLETKLKMNTWSFYKSLVQIDYSYCMTVHKAQGSEYASVCVLADDYVGREYARWLYTACTRAKKELIIKVK